MIVVNPTPDVPKGTTTIRLRFSTRGCPAEYSYAERKSPQGEIFQVRHQLRVATHHYESERWPPANICLDVAVIQDVNLDGYSANDYVLNSALLTFGEAKHMSAFAELIADFIGLVHEMQPGR